MATEQASEVLQHLRRMTIQDGGGMTDGQLLESFLFQRDDAALAALVRRHGPMVWGVCRSILRSHHDAEDAFQATFCVLVRKAAMVRDREAIGNWLYGVAHQTALRMRAHAARRGGREGQVVTMPEPTAAEQDFCNDLRSCIDRELSQLPEKYRVLLVLCDLEGKTRKDVARQLALPEGTVAGRLSRARAMLARRLSREGLAVTGTMLGAALSTQAATVPPAALSSTIHATTLLAAGKAAAISARVLALSEGVIKAMLWTKLKIVATVLLAAIVAGSVVPAMVRAGGESRKGPRGADAVGLVARADAEPKGARPSAADLAFLCSKMDVVRDRLKVAAAGEKTQKLQQEIVTRLTEIITALENLDKRTQRTLDLIAEFKLIRAMQNRIITRTEVLSGQYTGEEAPQPASTADPKEREELETLWKEMKELSERQGKLVDLVRKLTNLRE
jgi:RNA polymerase sigma factor (sigma-70 family)